MSSLDETDGTIKLKKAMALRDEENRGRGSDGPTASVLRVAESPPKETHRPQDANLRRLETGRVGDELVAQPGNRALSLLREGAMADHMRVLCVQILNQVEELGGNSVLVTSASPGEGKTFTTVNLGATLSHKFDRPTLLVDANVRNPSLGSYFGFEIAKGLTNDLGAQNDVRGVPLESGIPKLTVLPAGAPRSDSSDFFGPRLESLVKELRSSHPDRLLIFDGPCVSTRSDALLLSRLVDSVLFVVEAERTPAAAVRLALKLLRDRHVIGFVYNKSKEERSR